MKLRSIRARLLIWQLLSFLLLSAASCVFIAWLAGQVSYQIYDEQLLNSADSIVARIESDKDRIKVNLPPDAQRMCRHEDKDNFYYQVSRSGGKVIDCDEYILPPPKRARLGKPMFYQSYIKGVKVRALEMCIPDPGDGKNYVYVTVAETFRTRQAFFYQILFAFLAIEVLFAIAGALTIWLGVGQGLKPLRNLEHSLAQRSPTDLEPISAVDTPTEALPLVQIINTLLTQVQAHIESQSRFAANVAHQLRTPLTGVKTYVDLSLRSVSDPKLRDLLLQIDYGVCRLISLIERMLLLARSDPNRLASQTYAKIDLNSVVMEAAEELKPHCAAKQIALDFSKPANPIVISGDRLSLHELTKNITENAIAHSPTGGTVHIYIAKGDAVSLIVEDNGPGIPNQERERVFEPFYRLSSNRTPGTGLGLSIARDIARTHQATITIEDPDLNRGTKVVVKFPQPAAV
jgi:two-component system, OmpR family, sensor histidine kinase TctE